ncbi:hypothetical protein F443_01589 [Phytophthora nicotianae P1569]|uniref:NADP-dependent oxidoreductase domain-containing protein n=1 Tax=Phytophthora nicotianae P1569 TaxID=1317065 RepID=V9FXJ3_PHYNI|nr:hypothetical protein F443_01589 [Phytophthora nicotianae P1569]
MSVTVPTKTLPSGAEIPVIGLGVYKAEPGAEAYNAVLLALKLSYRHIDTAQFYQNEADVGRAVRDSGVPRRESFITSKLFTDNWGYKKAFAATIASNELLGLTYFDLYLLHTRDELLRICNTKEFSRTLAWSYIRPSLVEFCKEHNILLQAYSPLARTRKLVDPTVLSVAHEVGATPAQVLVANGYITLPKSANPERQQANLEVVNITLTIEQVSRLAALDEGLVVAWRSQDPIEDARFNK